MVLVVVKDDEEAGDHDGDADAANDLQKNIVKKYAAAQRSGKQNQRHKSMIPAFPAYFPREWLCC